uniref:Uncharacterized protein n=1 Tax=Arundo donax TaxID=35708 RepID=A0A0A9A9Y2_ARUDO
MSSASETPVPNGPMSKGECYTVLLAELRKMREGMGVMVRRLDQCRARVDGSLGDLVSESLPEEVTACGAHAEATDDVAAVAVAYVGISVTTLPVATMDATDCDVDDELQAPAVSTIAKEAVHVPDSSAAASSANGGVPNNVDFGAIAKCSTNCLRHAAGVPTSVTMSGAAPTSGLTSPVFVVNKLSHAALIVASPLHVCLGAHPVFDGKPVSFSILPSNFSKYKSMYNQPAAHQVSEKVLDGSTVILWLLPIALEWVEWHPCLPPFVL